MKPKKIWANLASADLDRTTQFYTKLGIKPNGSNQDLTSFLFGDDDFVVHFFKKDILKDAIKGELADPKLGNEIIFTLSATSRNETDNWAKEVVSAGGTLISEPEEFGNNYYGFVFADPDGHKFNVFFM